MILARREHGFVQGRFGSDTDAVQPRGCEMRTRFETSSKWNGLLKDVFVAIEKGSTRHPCIIVAADCGHRGHKNLWGRSGSIG